MGKKSETRIPDIEIIVRAANSDVAVVAMFAGDTPHEDWEVITGISDHDDIVHIRAALQAAVRSLDATDWFDVDELGVGSVSHGDGEPPF